MMILTRRGNNNEMFYSWEDYYKYMFNPEEAQKTTTLFFTLKGAKTYQEKKGSSSRARKACAMDGLRRLGLVG